MAAKQQERKEKDKCVPITYSLPSLPQGVEVGLGRMIAARKRTELATFSSIKTKSPSFPSLSVFSMVEILDLSIQSTGRTDSCSVARVLRSC